MSDSPSQWLERRLGEIDKEYEMVSPGWSVVPGLVSALRAALEWAPSEGVKAAAIAMGYSDE